MKYKVVLSKHSFGDLEEIYNYIAYRLRSTANAEAQLSRIELEIASLSYMPERYRRYDKEPWRSRGVRIVSVDNYCILYIPDSENKTVTIIRVAYGGRNLDRILQEHENAK